MQCINDRKVKGVKLRQGLPFLDLEVAVLHIAWEDGKKPVDMCKRFKFNAGLPG